jgi:hypothetical protein
MDIVHVLFCYYHVDDSFHTMSDANVMGVYRKKEQALDAALKFLHADVEDFTSLMLPENSTREMIELMQRFCCQSFHPITFSLSEKNSLFHMIQGRQLESSDTRNYYRIKTSVLQ